MIKLAIKKRVVWYLQALLMLSIPAFAETTKTDPYTSEWIWVTTLEQIENYSPSANFAVAKIKVIDVLHGPPVAMLHYRVRFDLSKSNVEKTVEQTPLPPIGRKWIVFCRYAIPLNLNGSLLYQPFHGNDGILDYSRAKLNEVLNHIERHDTTQFGQKVRTRLFEKIEKYESPTSRSIPSVRDP